MADSAAHSLLLLLAVLLAGCRPEDPVAIAPCQPWLVCVEDGTAAGDDVRVFVGCSGYPVIVASTTYLNADDVGEATAAAFARHPRATIAIVYQYRGDDVLQFRVVGRDE